MSCLSVVSEREQLIEDHLPLARSLARRYGFGGDLDDLYQVACLGLVKAADRFDPELGHAFKDYAVPTILGELKRHFRDHGWAVSITRGDKERVLALRRALAELSGRLGRSPTPGELSEETGLPVEQVIDGLELETASRAGSLDSHAGEDGADEWAGEHLGTVDGGIERVEERDEVRRRLRVLGTREREVLYLRFYEDLTQSEIGERIGCSQMHVSRITRRALDMSLAAGA